MYSAIEMGKVLNVGFQVSVVFDMSMGRVGQPVASSFNRWHDVTAPHVLDEVPLNDVHDGWV